MGLYKSISDNGYIQATDFSEGWASSKPKVVAPFK